MLRAIAIRSKDGGLGQSALSCLSARLFSMFVGPRSTPPALMLQHTVGKPSLKRSPRMKLPSLKLPQKLAFSAFSWGHHRAFSLGSGSPALPSSYLTDRSLLKFGLPSEIGKILAALGITKATGIQKDGLPAVLRGSSAVVAARSTTPRDYLVLLPSQELVLQVASIAKLIIETDFSDRAVVIPLSGGAALPSAGASTGADGRKARVFVATPAAFVNQCKHLKSTFTSPPAVVAFDEADLLLSPTLRGPVEDALLLSGAAEPLSSPTSHDSGKERSPAPSPLKTIRLRREATQFIACAATLLEPFSLKGKDKAKSEQKSFGAWLHRHLFAKSYGPDGSPLPPAEVFRSAGLHRPASLVKVRFSYVQGFSPQKQQQEGEEAATAAESEGGEAELDEQEQLEARRMAALVAALRTSIPAPPSAKSELATQLAGDVDSDAGVVSFSLKGPKAAPAAESGQVDAPKARKQALVFVNDLATAERVSMVLGDLAPDISVAYLHKEVPASKRASIVSKWFDGEIDVVVATDLAARGLDTTFVSHVVQYDLPADLPPYLHRLGRTARAGMKGLGECYYRSTESAHAEKEGKASTPLPTSKGPL
jgi:superfamily II DNA/RNA helicase